MSSRPTRNSSSPTRTNHWETHSSNNSSSLRNKQQRTTNRRTIGIRIGIGILVVLLSIFWTLPIPTTTTHPTQKSTIKNHRYDRFELHKEFEKVTAHLPEFPNHYIGTTQLLPSSSVPQKDSTGSIPRYRYQEYTQGDPPYRISSESIQQSNDVARERRSYIQQAMKHAWKGYTTYAFGMDELLPKENRGVNNWGGLGVTLIDSLDTLWIMNMKPEFFTGRDWVRDHFLTTTTATSTSNNNNKNRQIITKDVNVFEITIRILGGLLSSYDLSKDTIFLKKAYILAAKLMKSFDHSNTGIPYGTINLNTGEAYNDPNAGGNVVLSEFSTLQIEYRYLYEATKKTSSKNTTLENTTLEYKQKVERIYEILNEISPSNGLFPSLLINNPYKKMLPFFVNSDIKFGSQCDSLYEYMLKLWIQGDRKETMYRDMYDKAIQGMVDSLLYISHPGNLTYISQFIQGTIYHKMDHLTCFLGGTLALGAATDPRGFYSERAQRDLKIARSLTYTCYQMYARMKTGLSPEYVEFVPSQTYEYYESSVEDDDDEEQEGNDRNNTMDDSNKDESSHQDFIIASNSASNYLLRPETVESFYVLHFLTNDPIYREWGWEIFQSIEKYCKTESGYSSYNNVNKIEVEDHEDVKHEEPTPHKNRMESYFLSETLKYLYLLMDPDNSSGIDILNKHVFNTEAHPTKILPFME